MKNSRITGKTRTRQHVIADLAVNFLERHVLLCGHTVHRIQQDYGYDLTMFSFNQRGEAESGTVYFQVKATDDLPRLQDGKTISWPISRRDLKLWLGEAHPVVLILYDGKKNRAYWLHVQAYFSKVPSRELFIAGENVNVHIPVASRINRRAIQGFVRHKNELQSQLCLKSLPHG